MSHTDKTLASLGRIFVCSLIRKGLSELKREDFLSQESLEACEALMGQIDLVGGQVELPIRLDRIRPDPVTPASSVPAPVGPVAAPAPERAEEAVEAAPSKPVREKPERVKKKRAPQPPFMTPDRLERVNFHVAKDWENKSRPPMAINVRGTHGSGKTHIARMLLAADFPKEVVPDPENSNRDLMTIIRPPTSTGLREIAVIGSYKNACGGCDAITGEGTLHKIYDIVERQVTEHERHVFFEGIIVCSDFRRTTELSKLGFPIQIWLLDTPLEKCIEQVNSRRSEKGSEPLENTGNILAKHEGCLRSVTRFLAEGVDIRTVSVEQAMSDLREALLS